MRSDIDRAVAAIAAPQFGAFARDQARSVGAYDTLIGRRLASGHWIQEESGVYGFPGIADSYPRRLWVAHLAVGRHSKVSHEAAAALERLTGFPEGSLVFTVPHSGYHRVPGVTVHQISDLTDESCTVIHGLPVTSVSRTLVDLVAVTRAVRLAAALDDAVITQRKTTYAAVGREAMAIARRGKPRLRILLKLLDDRGPGKVPPQSVLERDLFEIIERFGLDEPVRQLPHPGRLFTAGCADAGYRREKLILEADGRRWHTRMRDLDRDHERDNEATRAGWGTLRLLHENIKGDPEGTADLIAETLEMRRTQLGITSTH